MKSFILRQSYFLRLKFPQQKFYQLSVKQIFNKKDNESSESEIYKEKIKKMKEFVENFEKIQKEGTPIPKDSKPLRIVYIDMNKKKKVSLNTEFKQQNQGKSETFDEKIEKSMYPKSRLLEEHELQEIKGKNEAYLEENFVKLTSIQKKKEIKLVTYRYPHKKDLKGVVYIMNGLFEHSNRNAYIAKLMSDKGFDVVSYDYRGHGKSEGVRGHIEDYEILMKDTENFINSTSGLYPENVPKFILGVSFGCLISNILCVKHENMFNGSVYFSPPFDKDIGIYSNWVKLGNILKNICPELKLLKVKEKPTENKAILDWTRKDQLCYNEKIRVSTGLAFCQTLKISNESTNKVKTPFFLIHGKNDKICNYRNSNKYYDNAKITDKTFILSDEIDHDIVRCDMIEKFIDDICYWMIQRLPK